MNYRKNFRPLLLFVVLMPVLAWGFQFGNRATHDRIKADLKKHKALASISVTVADQEVVLTGMVDSTKLKKLAGQIARTDAPGMRLLNYIGIHRKKTKS